MKLKDLPHDAKFLWNKEDEYPKRKVSLFIAAVGEVVTAGYYYIGEEGRIFSYSSDSNTEVVLL